MALDRNVQISKSYIYKITNPSGKIYIGQTKNLDLRMSYYKTGRCKNQVALYRSIVKYGWAAHTLEVIDECSSILPSMLDSLEIFWIAEFNSFKDGLNCTPGGTGFKGRVVSEETRKKMSDATKGKKRGPRSQEVKDKIAAGHRGKKQGPHSEEHKRKISEGNKGKTVTDDAKRKMSESKTGKSLSEAHIQALRDAKRPKQSQEQIEKRKATIAYRKSMKNNIIL